MARLVQADRNATIAQITTFKMELYRRALLNSQHVRLWRKWTATADDHLLNKKLKLHFAKYNKNWTIKYLKNGAWSNKSWFLVRYSDGSVRIWRKQYENINLALYQQLKLVFVVCEMEHTLEPLVPVKIV